MAVIGVRTNANLSAHIKQLPDTSLKIASCWRLTSQAMTRLGKSFLIFLMAKMTGVVGSSAQDPRPSFGKSNGTPKRRTELNPLATKGTKCSSSRLTPKRLTPGMAAMGCSASGSSLTNNSPMSLSIINFDG